MRDASNFKALTVLPRLRLRLHIATPGGEPRARRALARIYITRRSRESARFGGNVRPSFRGRAVGASVSFDSLKKWRLVDKRCERLDAGLV